jgi:copper ion binding protein
MYKFMTQKTLTVEGMTCQHCVKTITDALNGLSGVYKVEVHLNKREVKIEYDEEITTLKQISSRIIDLGFELLKD